MEKNTKKKKTEIYLLSDWVCNPVITSPTDIPHSKHGKVISIPNILVSNVRSLEPKIDELSCILKLNAVNVACITETWLKPEIPDSMVSIQDFNLYRKDRSTRGGGIAAYVSSSIQCKRLIDKELCESITETMWIHLKPHRLPRSVSTILLGVVTLEGIQKRALSIIYPESSYDVALKRSNLTTLVSRRADACRRFIESIQPNNPLYHIIKHNCAVRVDKPYNLRHKSEAKVPYNTFRFRNFVTYKYS